LKSKGRDQFLKVIESPRRKYDLRAQWHIELKGQSLRDQFITQLSTHRCDSMCGGFQFEVECVTHVSYFCLDMAVRQPYGEQIERACDLKLNRLQRLFSKRAVQQGLRRAENTGERPWVKRNLLRGQSLMTLGVVGSAAVFEGPAQGFEQPYVVQQGWAQLFDDLTLDVDRAANTAAQAFETGPYCGVGGVNFRLTKIHGCGHQLTSHLIV
jgi:hypothetical protein